MTDQLIAEQIAYYDARAPEYEDAYKRCGNFGRGAKHNQQWKSELETLERVLLEFKIKGNVLEMACGTRHWTRLLASEADYVMAVDASSKMLDLARARTRGVRLNERTPAVVEDIPYETRPLTDGREFGAVKVVYSLDELILALRALGWIAQVTTTERFFFYDDAR